MRWGRLSVLVTNSKGLVLDDALFFVFAQEENQLFAIELNTGSPNIDDRGQLFLHGIDATDTPLSDIGGNYTFITTEIKKFSGLPFDRVPLYQEGDFYRSFTFKQGKDSFNLSADTIKEGADLRERRGENILGLTNESIYKLGREIIPEVIAYVKKQLLS